MASISKRGTFYHARIRRRGYPTLARTIDTKADAHRWVIGRGAGN